MSPRWEPDPDVRRGRSVVHNLHVHLVFLTKYRGSVFNAQMLTRREEVMRAVCGDFGADLREFNGQEDHVHLLVHYPPSVALSRLLNSLKGVSLRYLRVENVARFNRAGTRAHLWSPSYFAASCGGAPLAIVKDYIAQQKQPD